MKILNLYACLGGNRYLWGNEHEITAIELDESLCELYKKRFPNDRVICTDAHEYLLNNYKNFDFIWTSPPCPSHSKVRISAKNKDFFKPVYPDLKLYEEIIFLDNFFNGKYCVENVIPYYEPLIKGQKRGRHIYWCNFLLPVKLVKEEKTKGILSGGQKNEFKKLCELHKIDLTDYKGKQRKDKIARNLVDYEVGKTILDVAMNIINKQNTHQIELNF